MEEVREEESKREREQPREREREGRRRLGNIPKVTSPWVLPAVSQPLDTNNAHAGLALWL